MGARLRPRATELGRQVGHRRPAQGFCRKHLPRGIPAPQRRRAEEVRRCRSHQGLQEQNVCHQGERLEESGGSRGQHDESDRRLQPDKLRQEPPVVPHKGESDGKRRTGEVCLKFKVQGSEFKHFRLAGSSCRVHQPLREMPQRIPFRNAGFATPRTAPPAQLHR